jgi:hypothetical protein
MPKSHRSLSCRLPESEAELVEAYAAASGDFVSHVIRRAVLREVREAVAVGAARQHAA